MSKIEIENINIEWSKLLAEKNIHNYIIYEPFENYWNEKVKLMVCNLETYGYEDCGATKVDLDLITQWMRDTNITKTTRNTAVFINAYKEATRGVTLTAQEIRKTYSHFEDLLKMVSTISYMNFRKESNSRVNQDENSIISEIKEYKPLLRKYILGCEPSILFVGGKVGVRSFNTIFEPINNLKYNSEIKYEGIRIISLKHLSRISYSYIEQRIKNIIDNEKAK